MKCFRILLLFFIVAYINTLNAKSVNDFNIFNFTNDNGLPQNSVKSIEQDKDGYMWMATESGLVRFDGKNFRIYNRDNLHTLLANRISHVGIMHDRNIYFIDENSNVYIKSNKGSIDKQDKRANSDLLINVSSGLYTPFLNLDTAEFRYLKSKFINRWTNNILFLQTTDTCTGFVSINKNIIAYVSGKSVLWIDSLENCNRHVLNCSGILNSRLYYLDYDYRISSLDSGGIKRRISITGLAATGGNKAKQPAFYSLLQQGADLYLLYANDIYRLHYANDQTLSAEFVLEAGNIPNITCFRNLPGINTYVLGSNTKGLFLLKRKRFSTFALPDTDNIFYAQASYRDSGILTHLGVIMPKGMIRFPFDKIKKLAIFKDSKGTYWLNKAAESIIQIDDRFTILREIKLSDFYVNSFAETPDGSIWLITNKNKLGKVTNTGINWLQINASPNSMSTLMPADDQNLWVGGRHMLFSINILTKRIINYTYFKDHDVRYLGLDREKTLWIGTYGKGFFALKNGKIIKFPVDPNGHLRFVHTLLEDRRGNVWITTNNGMLRTRKSSLEDYMNNRTSSIYYQHYSKEQGFLTNEFNGGCNPSGLEFKDGRLSFPSMEGIVQFHPDSLHDIYPTSKIFIDDLFADGKQMMAKNAVTLPPSFSRLEINISSPYFDNPSNQQIEYKLTELDDRWYPVSATNTIIFNRLPYGAYHLLLRKKGGFGINNYVTSSLLFNVSPFLYQEWYFKVAVLVIFILLVLLFFRLRYFILIKKQYKLEQKVQQRTRELVYNNRLREKLTLLIAHDLQSPLHFLTILARHIHKAALNKDLDSVLEGSEEMKNTTTKIYAFVEEFNLWNMSLNENYKLSKTSFHVGTLLEELKQFFEEMLRLKNNSLSLTYEKELNIVTDRDVFKAILRNIIDNANKYTHNGAIVINAERDEGNCIILSVSDTGDGMTDQQMEKINYRINQEHSIPAIEKDGRLGFQLIIDFTARLGAKINVYSVRKQGTTITLSGLACD